MMSAVTRVWGAVFAAGVLMSSFGCHLIFPHESRVEEVESCYLFSAQLYRQLPGTTQEFTEEWRLYGWPDGQYKNDPMGYMYWKLGDYIQHSVSPYVGWNTRNMSWVAVSREKAVDCSNPSYVPNMWGAPLGAVLRWNNPPATEASVWFALTDKDGTYRQAEPAVKTAYIDVAERTGMPDWSSGGAYILGKKHLRFSDMFLELATPFQLGPGITINKCYIQSVGGIVAEWDGVGIVYRIYPSNSKLFFYATGTKDGEGGTTSFCCTNTSSQNVHLSQAGPQTHFALSLSLTPSELGEDMRINVSLVKPWSQPSLFNAHQPYVELVDKEVQTAQVDLTPDIINDVDGDIQRVLWLENFEAGNEKYLGSSYPLRVTFTPGPHKVTVLAYDARGAYGTATMTLTYTPPPPPANDACSNATVISPGWYLGTLLGATNDGSSTCGGYVSGQPNMEADAWYKYTALANGLLSVGTCGTHDWGGIDAGMDTVLSVHSGCPGTSGNQLQASNGCNDDWPTSTVPTACSILPWPFLDQGVHRDSAVAVPVTAGQTVLIRVSKYATAIPNVFYLILALDTGTPPDFDLDGDVDLADFTHFLACFNGPARPPGEANCGNADFDHDNDVDLTDFQVFLSCFNGPNRPAACTH